MTIAALSEYTNELERLSRLKSQLMRNEIPVELTGDTSTPEQGKEQNQRKPVS